MRFVKVRREHGKEEWTDQQVTVPNPDYEYLTCGTGEGPRWSVDWSDGAVYPYDVGLKWAEKFGGKVVGEVEV